MVTPLRVWILSDGRPGHYNQSRGIVCALQHLCTVETVTITVKLRFGLARNLLRLLLNRFSSLSSLKLLRILCRMDALPESHCDLIVSVGGRTSFANAWLARSLNVPSIFCGSLRRLSADLFTVVLTLEPLQCAANNLVLGLPPSPVDALRVDAKGKEFRKQSGVDDQRCWLMLLGGDGAGYRYQEQDWIQLLTLMQVLAERNDIRWLIAASGRTGKASERWLKKHLDRLNPVAQYWSDSENKFDLEENLGMAERVFVSEDSMTMLTEAIYSQRPVYSVSPAHALPTNRYEKYMKNFAGKKWMLRYAINELLDDPDALNKASCEPLKQSPLLELSERLKYVIE